MIASILLALLRGLRGLLHVIWKEWLRHAGKKGPPTEAEHSPLRPPPGGEAAWTAHHVTCGNHVEPQEAQQQNILREPNKSAHRSSTQALSRKLHRQFLPPRPLVRLCVFWLLGLHHNGGNIFVASQGLFCNEVSQVVVAGTASGSADGVGSSASFNEPYGMSTTPDGSFVLIADFNNHKIRKLVVSSGSVSTFAGSGTASVGNGIGTNANLKGPLDVSISSDGVFAVSTSYGGHRIRHIVLSSRLVTTIAGDGSTGHVNAVGTNSRINYPAGISLYSGDSRALIGDQSNHRVRLIVLSSLQVTTVAGSGTGGGSNGIGTSATLYGPRYIAVSSNNEFAVVSEWDGHRVRKVVLSTWAVSTLAGSPSGTSSSSDGVGTLATFNRPHGLSFTSDDMYVYVVDCFNHEIRRVEVSSRLVVTLASQAGSTALTHPTGVTWLTQDSVLLVSNGGSNRVLQIYGTCAAPTSLPTSGPSIPSTTPTSPPTFVPTPDPSGEPSGVPSGHPSSDPSSEPSATPTSEPTAPPTSVPTADPSGEPSGIPSGHPSSDPSSEPSATPTSEPTEPTTSVPTADPSGEPSGIPSGHPSSEIDLFPTMSPFSFPSARPVVSLPGGPMAPPTAGPTLLPQYFSTLKAYGGLRGDYVTAIAISASDWGSVLAGYDIGSNAAEYDGYLVKLDKCGEMMWSKSYGGPLGDSIERVLASHDGSVVFVGQWTNPTSRNAEVLLGRLDPHSGDLNHVLSFSLIEGGASKGMGLVLNDNDSVLIAGTTVSALHSRALILLVEFSGSIIWSLALQGDVASQSYHFNDATRLANGDYVMVGHGCVSSACVSIVSRVSANGEWRRTSQWGVKGFDKAYSIARCRDGGYVIAAASRDFTPTDGIAVLRFNSKDRLMWTMSFDSSGHDMPSKIIVTHDEGYLVVGSTAINRIGFSKGCLIKLNSTGHMEWARGYGKGTSHRDFITDVAELPGGGYRATGYGVSYKASLSLDAFMTQVTPKGDLSDTSLMEDISDAFRVEIITVATKEVPLSERLSE